MTLIGFRALMRMFRVTFESAFVHNFSYFSVLNLTNDLLQQILLNLNIINRHFHTSNRRLTRLMPLNAFDLRFLRLRLPLGMVRKKIAF